MSSDNAKIVRMILRFRLLSGPRKGQEFRLNAGDVVGRSSTAISLLDPKVSSRHAEVKCLDEGVWELVDLGSANGIRYLGKKTRRILLKPGTQFRIGNTDIEVVEEKSSEPNRPVNPNRSIGAPPAPPENKVTIQDFLSQVEALSSHRKPSQFTILENPVEVTCVTGLEAGTTWFLSYLPRDFGYENIDIRLTDPSLGSKNLQLQSVTRSDIQCELNGEEKVTLKSGQTYEFGPYVFRVEVLKA
ncbi:MAG: hypothetical protein COT74_04315 [Bdellovibrionales bacterium CG10_big_fil_rev_8_21_14_0_10_45_34]|nr:MAG: hypothetical protein COT74_04315 [Bdellovibrionales bacterium CG10_big_fil_rev_8_21_14_0_10_45_34]